MTEQTSYSPGVGKVTSPLGTSASEYYHCDLVGTTRLLTDSSGTQGGSSVLTSFGEHVAGSTHRYGYAGAHGYQTDDDQTSSGFPFLHVGHRYYDPSTGRFLQRDPIGINGGLNVYEYVGSRPTVSVDPTGFGREELGMWLTVFGMLMDLLAMGIGQALRSYAAWGPLAVVPGWIPVAGTILLVSGTVKLLVDIVMFWPKVKRIIKDFIEDSWSPHTRGIEHWSDCTTVANHKCDEGQ